MGYSGPLKVDLEFGSITRARLIKFQNYAKVTPDGYYGPETYRALEKRDKWNC